MRANALSSDNEVSLLWSEADAASGDVNWGGSEGSAWKKPAVEEEGVDDMFNCV